MFLSFAHRPKFALARKVVSSVMAFAFLTNLATPAGAQLASLLPTPGSAVTISPVFMPPLLKGVLVHPENPFLFDFVVSPGQDKVSGQTLKDESQKLVKFFLTAMTIPDKEAWVNLSPYEKDRIIPPALGETQMGQVMLEQDYALKQMSSAMTDPRTELGAKFWQTVRQNAQAKLGTTDVPMSTFNKVWIVPGKAEVAQEGGQAYVTESSLKVMMEEDYEALQKTVGNKEKVAEATQTNKLTSQVFRTMILPKLEENVNTSKEFSGVRQIYEAAILAVWYKEALKESLLGKIYADKSKVKGIESLDKDYKQGVYARYLEAFKQGAYNFIREEADASGEVIPRRYFSGGARLLPEDVRIIDVDSAGSAIKDAKDAVVVSAAVVETPEEGNAVAASPLAEEFRQLSYELFGNLDRVEDKTIRDSDAIYLAPVLDRMLSPEFRALTLFALNRLGNDEKTSAKTKGDLLRLIPLIKELRNLGKNSDSQKSAGRFDKVEEIIMGNWEIISALADAQWLNQPLNIWAAAQAVEIELLALKTTAYNLGEAIKARDSEVSLPVGQIHPRVAGAFAMLLSQRILSDVLFLGMDEAIISRSEDIRGLLSDVEVLTDVQNVLTERERDRIWNQAVVLFDQNLRVIGRALDVYVAGVQKEGFLDRLSDVSGAATVAASAVSDAASALKDVFDQFPTEDLESKKQNRPAAYKATLENLIRQLINSNNGSDLLQIVNQLIKGPKSDPFILISMNLEALRGGTGSSTTRQEIELVLSEGDLLNQIRSQVVKVTSIAVVGVEKTLADMKAKGLSDAQMVAEILGWVDLYLRILYNRAISLLEQDPVTKIARAQNYQQAYQMAQADLPEVVNSLFFANNVRKLKDRGESDEDAIAIALKRIQTREQAILAFEESLADPKLGLSKKQQEGIIRVIEAGVESGKPAQEIVQELKTSLVEISRELSGAVASAPTEEEITKQAERNLFTKLGFSKDETPSREELIKRYRDIAAGIYQIPDRNVNAQVKLDMKFFVETNTSADDIYEILVGREVDELVQTPQMLEILKEVAVELIIQPFDAWLKEHASNKSLDLAKIEENPNEVAKYRVRWARIQDDKAAENLQNVQKNSPSGSAEVNAAQFVKDATERELLDARAFFVKRIGSNDKFYTNGDREPIQLRDEFESLKKRFIEAQETVFMRGNADAVRLEIENAINEVEKLMQDQDIPSAQSDSYQEWVAQVSDKIASLEAMLNQQDGDYAAFNGESQERGEQKSVSSQVGGINFDPTLMNLQVKRDKNGVPLPLPQQDLQNINIEGLYPVIINIAPATMANFPLLSKAAEEKQKIPSDKDDLSPMDRQKTVALKG